MVVSLSVKTGVPCTGGVGLATPFGISSEKPNSWAVYVRGAILRGALFPNIAVNLLWSWEIRYFLETSGGLEGANSLEMGKTWSI